MTTYDLHVVVTQEHIERGVRGNALECPIALALQDAGVLFPLASPQGSIGIVDGSDVEIELPAEARKFISDFDYDEYDEIGVSPFEFDAHVERVEAVD